MLQDRDSLEAREMMADADTVRLETEPANPYPDLRVRLLHTAEMAASDRRWRRHYERRCNMCQIEYRWFWHKGKNVIFAVCPGLDCGRGYFPVGPEPPGTSRRLSRDRNYRGQKARSAWRTYRGAQAVMR